MIKKHSVAAKRFAWMGVRWALVGGLLGVIIGLISGVKPLDAVGCGGLMGAFLGGMVPWIVSIWFLALVLLGQVVATINAKPDDE